MAGLPANDGQSAAAILPGANAQTSNPAVQAQMAAADAKPAIQAAGPKAAPRFRLALKARDSLGLIHRLPTITCR
jgi:hypothetical protein